MTFKQFITETKKIKCSKPDCDCGMDIMTPQCAKHPGPLNVIYSVQKARMDMECPTCELIIVSICLKHKTLELN